MALVETQGNQIFTLWYEKRVYGGKGNDNDWDCNCDGNGDNGDCKGKNNDNGDDDDMVILSLRMIMMILKQASNFFSMKIKFCVGVV